VDSNCFDTSGLDLQTDIIPTYSQKNPLLSTLEHMGAGSSSISAVGSKTNVAIKKVLLIEDLEKIIFHWHKKIYYLLYRLNRNTR